MKTKRIFDGRYYKTVKVEQLPAYKPADNDGWYTWNIEEGGKQYSISYQPILREWRGVEQVFENGDWQDYEIEHPERMAARHKLLRVG
jgi:hypothetical protein